MKVQLDTTLADLFRNDASIPPKDKIVYCAVCPSSEFTFSSEIPRNTKYVYQDGAVNAKKDPKDMPRAAKEASIQYLALRAQRFAFAAGNMPVILFDIKAEYKNDGRKDCLNTMEVLQESQRPIMRYYAGPDDVRLGEDELMIMTLPIDGLEHLRQIMSVDVHYQVLSKRELSVSGLKSPAAEVIDIRGLPDKNCTSSGKLVQVIERKIEELQKRVSQRTLPFVLKLQQRKLSLALKKSLSGEGTYLVKTEDERREMQRLLSDIVLPKVMMKVTPANADLLPASVVITDLIEDATTLPITFFLKKNGETQFLCCTKQKMRNGKHWVGGTITFPDQAQLEIRTRKTVLDIAAYLHGKGYYGPVGADVLEDSHGTQYIVDLNVRASGSMILGLMGTHFMSRNLPEAALITEIVLKMSRESFEEIFAKDLEQGSMVITAWYHDQIEDISFASIVLGSTNSRALDDYVSSIEALGIDGSGED